MTLPNNVVITKRDSQAIREFKKKLAKRDGLKVLDKRVKGCEKKSN